MSKWKKVKLGEIGVIITGNTPKTSDKENYSSKDISFYKPSDIAENNVSYLNISEAYVSEVARSKVRILPKGSILVTCIGIIGKIGILEHEATCNQQINAIIPDQDICLNRYIAYSIFFNRDKLRDIANAPVVPIVNKTQFSNMIIPLPPIEEQKRIADILDKASSLIDLRKQQLEKMDLLIKSKFIDVFGDPIANPKGWKVEKLEKHISVIGGYAFKSNGFSKQGVPVLRIGNINSGFFKSTNLVFWNEDQTLARYMLKPGDMIISLTGTVGKDDYGNICILGNDYSKYYLNQRNAKLELKNTIDKRYLSNILKMQKIKSKLTDISRGVRQANIANADILNLSIPIPPVELQNQFAAFVEQVEKQKVVMQQSLEKMEMNYKALMQEYFG